MSRKRRGRRRGRRKRRRRRRRRRYNVNLTNFHLGENPGIFKGLFVAHPLMPALFLIVQMEKPYHP